MHTLTIININLLKKIILDVILTLVLNIPNKGLTLHLITRNNIQP